MLCGNLSVGGRVVLKRFLFPYLGVPVALSVVWLIVAVPVGDALEPDSLSSDRIYDLDCGRSLVDPPNGDVSLVQSVRVALAVDEEWRDLTIGSDASSPRGVLLAAGTGTASRAPSPTLVTPKCWRIWSAPTGTTIDRLLATATWPKWSRCWLGVIRT